VRGESGAKGTILGIFLGFFCLFVLAACVFVVIMSVLVWCWRVNQVDGIYASWSGFSEKIVQGYNVGKQFRNKFWAFFVFFAPFQLFQNFNWFRVITSQSRVYNCTIFDWALFTKYHWKRMILTRLPLCFWPSSFFLLKNLNLPCRRELITEVVALKTEREQKPSQIAVE